MQNQLPVALDQLYTGGFSEQTRVWMGIQVDLALGGNFFHSHPLSTHNWYQNVNFPASVQADFHWAGLQMKAQSHKIHTCK